MKIGIINLSEKYDLNYKDKYTKKGIRFIHLYLDSQENQPLEHMDAVFIYDKNGSDIREYCNCILEIRKRGMFPIMLMVNDLSNVDRLILLKLGINGFVDLDYNLEELMLITENNSNLKLNIADEENEKVIFQVDDRNRSAILNGKMEIYLTKIEYKLLSIISSDITKVFTYEKLFNEIWDCEFSQINTSLKDIKPKVANVVFSLRTKLKLAGADHNYIQTVRSIGYKFCDRADINLNS
ncbi:winged helix-turn-helix domain-containing protein [Candidatus Enterococcus mansonii]|uniref:OmpR/PhoB-type domain-containing protein n=1 Tax=Candidatus Enterococcus mansonii TaxID=1834181 RepID=A0ABU8IFB6_9ENTE